MANILNRVPPNELYNRIQNCPCADKEFKKSILNMYKRHPKVAERVLFVIEDINKKRIIPKGFKMESVGCFFREQDKIDVNDELFEDIVKTHSNYIKNAKNVFSLTLYTRRDNIPFVMSYYLFEMKDGKFHQFYSRTK